MENQVLFRLHYLIYILIKFLSAGLYAFLFILGEWFQYAGASISRRHRNAFLLYFQFS